MKDLSTIQVKPSLGPRLRRDLTLWDLLLFGVIILSPVSPMSFFGVLNQRGHGHAATAILIAMFAMILTAVSYGRMSRVYPSAGSAFTYVGQEVGSLLGYVTGWSIVMDYIMNPVIAIIWSGEQAHAFVPSIPYWVWVSFFAIVLTALNVQAVKTSARVNIMLASAMGLVAAGFFVAATHYVLGHPHTGSGFFTRPFYDPETWSWKGILGGTSLAVLTYIGFDGISTLSEEAKNPRHVLPAMVLTCLLIGILAVLEVYAAQLVWPVYESYPNLDTAFSFVAQRAWAPLFGAVGLTVLVASLGCGMAAQLGAARLLYAMGRSGALRPISFFGAIDPRKHVPRNNVLLVGVLALVGALFLPRISGRETGFELGANLVNFGALVAFMGVNAAAFVRFYWRAGNKRIANGLPPALGFLVCLLLWWNLSTPARVCGALWVAIGLAFGAWKTRGFQDNLVIFEIPLSVSEDEIRYAAGRDREADVHHVVAVKSGLRDI